MCWKRLNPLIFFRQRSRGKWPISFVLTVFYTASASAILFLATGFLYWMMARNMAEEDNHSLSDQIEVIRSILRERPNDTAALADRIQSEGAVRRFARYYPSG